MLINNEECPSTYHDFIRVHYSVQTMCNSQDCTLFELLTNGLLDKTVSPERMQKHSNTLHFGCWYFDILLFLLFINLWIAKSEAINKNCTNCQWRHFINQICCIRPEVLYLGSTFAVASSIISMWFCLRMALARQISWRWPTLKLDPPSDTSESSCPGRSSTADFNWTWY